MIEEPTEYEVALATVPAPVQATPLDVELLEALAECGCEIPNIEMAVAAIQPSLDKICNERAASALRLLFARMQGKKGIEVQLALLGLQGRSWQSWADEIGITRQSLRANVYRWQKLIFGKTSAPSALSDE